MNDNDLLVGKVYKRKTKYTLHLEDMPKVYIQQGENIIVLEHLGVGRYKILCKGIIGVITTGIVFWDLIVGDNE